ncbi:hypothetical protein E2P81_ATG11203 [Venturia nashicola]|nr:hypothetical protein E2P81_ATG11203 [Venturia nashicola]
MDYILHKSQQEYERYRAEAKQNKRTASILKPQVETLEQQLKTLRENEEKMTKKYDKSLKTSFQLIKEEKRKTMEANDLFTDKLRIELASASQKLKQEQIRYERLGAKEKSLVQRTEQTARGERQKGCPDRNTARPIWVGSAKSFGRARCPKQLDIFLV